MHESNYTVMSHVLASLPKVDLSLVRRVSSRGVPSREVMNSEASNQATLQSVLHLFWRHADCPITQILTLQFHSVMLFVDFRCTRNDYRIVRLHIKINVM